MTFTVDPAAEQVALEWLRLVDTGDGRASWRSAATLFRTAVTEAQWAQSLHSVRESLGTVMERQLREARVATQLPGAPDGEYVIFQFDTRFARKQVAVETVTPMRDADGIWRVSGYYIR